MWRESLHFDVPVFIFSSFMITRLVTRHQAITKLLKIGRDNTKSSINPPELVKSSCQDVVRIAKSVSIDTSVITSIAKDLARTDLESLLRGVNWNENSWHYCEDADAAGPKTCQYIFVLDALNFCFWPVQDLEYDYLATALKDAFMEDERNFEADFLKNINEEILQSWFPLVEIPLLKARVQRLRELGAVLSEKFDGLACNVVFAAKNDAVMLVRMIIENFPGFRDAYMHPKSGEYVHFYKRAQILVGDIWAAYSRPKEGHLYYLKNMEELTTFADYRVPQLLRNLGVLKYDDDLAKAIDSYEPIDCGSTKEMEIRASTVIAVDMLHKILSSQGFHILVVELDWLLWQKGEKLKETLKPHHRTLTIFY